MASILTPYIPLIVVLIVCSGGLALGHKLLIARHQDLGSEARLPRQIALLILTILSVVIAIIAAPLADSTRDQVLTLMGIGLSAAIALSSTSFVTNFMAAVMLRVTRPFRVGDLIKIGDLFGKVSERGLFDTEIQTENRELIAIPNATFITQPVTVARKSGVIISTTVSLGYDIRFAEIEPHMLEAATESGLTGPYVHIIELGDFSISYRVCGLLTELDGILTARSELNRQLLLKIHGAGFEIVSPTVARHISHAEDYKIVPHRRYVAPREDRVQAEEIVFDRATEIANLEATRKELKVRLQELKDAKDDSVDTTALTEELERTETALKELKKEKS